MKYFFAIFITLLIEGSALYSQVKVTHKVEKGETINQIAQSIT
jgi:hypothetical protein